MKSWNRIKLPMLISQRTDLTPEQIDLLKRAKGVEFRNQEDVNAYLRAAYAGDQFWQYVADLKKAKLSVPQVDYRDVQRLSERGLGTEWMRSVYHLQAEGLGDELRKSKKILEAYYGSGLYPGEIQTVMEEIKRAGEKTAADMMGAVYAQNEDIKRKAAYAMDAAKRNEEAIRTQADFYSRIFNFYGEQLENQKLFTEYVQGKMNEAERDRREKLLAAASLKFLTTFLQPKMPFPITG